MLIGTAVNQRAPFGHRAQFCNRPIAIPDRRPTPRHTGALHLLRVLLRAPSALLFRDILAIVPLFNWFRLSSRAAPLVAFTFASSQISASTGLLIATNSFRALTGRHSKVSMSTAYFLE